MRYNAATMYNTFRLVLSIIGLAFLVACASYPLNAAIDEIDSSSGYRLTNRTIGDQNSDETKVMFREQMGEAFLAELSKGEHFTIVTEVGPDVLLIRGSLIDVISKVPQEHGVRSDTFLSEVGQATLVFEIRDSVSDGISPRCREMGYYSQGRPG